MNNTEIAAANLDTYIRLTAKKMINLEVNNTVLTGTIVNASGAGYNINLDTGNTTTIFALPIGNAVFQENDYVYLIQAEVINADPVYYIFGKLAEAQEAFFNLSLEERFEGEESYNISSDDTAALNYIITTDTTEGNNIINKIKISGVLKIEGIFTTKADVSDDYGLKIVFSKEEDKSEETKAVEYFLNPPYFIGQPKNMANALQSRIILLTKQVQESDFDTITISTFGTGFSYSGIQLTCGYILAIDGVLNVNISAENNKNFFYKKETNIQNNIELIAKVTYNGQELNANETQYYWVVDSSTKVLDTNQRYLALAGEDWLCLNSFQKVSGVREGSSFTLQIWNKDANKLTLTEGDFDFFPNYEHTIKCIVKYKDLIAEKTIKIYNYEREQLMAQLSSSVTPARIIFKEDKFDLTCNIVKKINEETNELIKDSEYNNRYTWYKKQEESDPINITPYTLTEQGVKNYINTKTLTIQDRNVSAENGETVYEMSEALENIYCSVEIFDKTSRELITTEESNIISIESKTTEEATISSYTCYKYYISKNMDVSFSQAQETTNEEEASKWNGDWAINDKNAEGESIEGVWTALKDAEEKDIINNEGLFYILSDVEFIFTKIEKELLEQKPYVYYTQRNVWIQTKDGQVETIREENWSFPLIGRQVGYVDNVLENLAIGTAIDQLNTFNQLTDYGRSQGLLYKDNDVYINASLIKTGTLLVKDKFFATIDEDEQKTAVQIAGFTVDENSLSSGKENEGKYVYLGTDGIQIGDAVSVKIAEDGQAIGEFKGSFIFSNGEKIDEVIEDIALRQLKVVYSNSEDIPNESPKGPEETGNIGENKLWHETLQEDDIWMCQKVATDIYDNSDGVWGNIVQIQGLDGEIGMTGPGVKKQEEQYSRSSSSTTTDDTEEWYSKEVFFARESLWADSEDVKDYPYVWKRIKTTYTNEMEEYSTPLLLSNLDAATLAATAQIEDQEGKDPSVIVAEWCKEMGRTIIDGSTIVSGSITADQIKAGTITADQIDTDDLFAAQAAIGGWIIGTDCLVSQNKNVTLFSSKEETERAIAAGRPQFLISSVDEITVYYKIEIDGIHAFSGNSAADFLLIHDFGYDPYVGKLYLSNTVNGVKDIYYYQGQKEYQGVLYDYWVKTKNEEPYSWGGYTNIIVENGDPPFALYNDGSLYASNATVSGTINANDGNIGGWLIGADCLMSQNENVKLFSSEGTTEYAITAGAEVDFSISSPDEIIIYYHKWDWDDGSTDPLWDGDNFSKQNITWNIGKDSQGCYLSNTYKDEQDEETDLYYYKGKKQLDGTTYDYWESNYYNGISGVYTNIITISKPPFILYNDGKLYADGAYISGKITATEGKIGKWLITDYGTLGNEDQTIYLDPEAEAGTPFLHVGDTFDVFSTGEVRAWYWAFGNKSIFDIKIKRQPHFDTPSLYYTQIGTSTPEDQLVSGEEQDNFQIGMSEQAFHNYPSNKQPFLNAEVSLTRSHLYIKAVTEFDPEEQKGYNKHYYKLPWKTVADSIVATQEKMIYGMVTDKGYDIHNNAVPKKKIGDWYYFYLARVPESESTEWQIYVTAMNSNAGNPLQKGGVETVVIYSDGTATGTNVLTKKGYWIGYKPDSSTFGDDYWRLLWLAIHTTAFPNYSVDNK